MEYCGRGNMQDLLDGFVVEIAFVYLIYSIHHQDNAIVSSLSGSLNDLAR